MMVDSLGCSAGLPFTVFFPPPFSVPFVVPFTAPFETLELLETGDELFLVIGVLLVDDALVVVTVAVELAVVGVGRSSRELESIENRLVKLFTQLANTSSCMVSRFEQLDRWFSCCLSF